MSGSRCDVIVAGAGLPGLALAAALARAGIRVMLADRAPINVGQWDADTFDARVYAISPGSVAFLETLGAWPRMPRDRVAAVEAMDVKGDEGATITFSAYDLGERALAWIVEERALRAALVHAADDAGVTIIAPGEFQSLAFTPGNATLAFDDGRTIAANLIVGADGVRSWVRSAAGIVASPIPYGQTGVVANFCCEAPHRGIARQWFLADGGVLAWLPLPGRRISISWAAGDARAQALVALDAASLASEVANAGSHALGRLDVVTAPKAFPLSFLKLPALVAHRLALVGDAAHGVHPLAGQGVNLGFGDAQALSATLASRGPVADVGAPILLERYARARAEPVLAMQTVTDGLARLFGARSRFLAGLRNAGLAAVDRLPVAKHFLARAALR
ncbi:MAG TPA: FAD-dependent monooxygenase [Casimicrobiaceae bacterium]|nr:FAD-dependent monooxygenase [Casimicrobiaceae bacterium]